MGKMTKLGNIHTKAAQKASKKVIRKRVKSRMVRRLEKSRPRRFMNQFLCFAHEERMKAKNGRLLSDWKAAHKGLGGKWRALGAGRAKFHKSGKVPAFALYVKESPKHKELLPAWRNAHKGLGARWKALDKASKGKYVAASKRMAGQYEQQMKIYRNKKQELLRQIRSARSAKKAAKKQKKTGVALKKKSRAIAKKASKKQKKVKAPSKNRSRAFGKPKKVAKRAAKKSKKGMNAVSRKINARIRITSISSRSML